MKSKTIIGARSLSKEEVKQILPTYDKIFDQIDDFRNNRSFYNENEKKDDRNTQKTNNIGIMGCRGAGKTSVLKTISKRMKEDTEDIILPIIIPENMSESSTLMATILGLFKTVVDDIVKEKNKNNFKKCIYEDQDKLQDKYNEAIKQYVFIQNDYRNILMNQFTTENEYVKKTNEVFNSDSEFINKFNDFIEELVNRKSKDNNQDKKTLIIIFIDDIDLSTTRCSDVVKTLLSYLSNENIVTIISGDLNTFEEALTIEFLRQEKALDKNVMEQKYLGNDETLLNRKKILAYEYLKKVIPPTYRHNIKYWSLSTKASYSIDIDDKKMELGDLLIDVLQRYLDKSFFKYFDYNDNQEYNLPYTYNLFDNTSRGLNNVYNMLIQIKDKQENEKKENYKKIDYSDKKLLIETIAASKPLYNSYRAELFEKIIQFGNNENSTIIKWDNLSSLLDFMNYDENENKKDNDDKAIEDYEINNKKQRDKFSIFIFVYFAAKLLDRYDSKEDEFINLKRKIIDILINNPEISESLVKLEKKIKLVPIAANNSKDNNYYYKSFNMISDFLYKFDFEVSLLLYKYLSDKNFNLKMLDDTKLDDTDIKSFNIRSIWITLKSYCIILGGNYTVEGYIYEIYNDFIQEFSYIQNSFSDDEPKFVLQRTIENTIKKILYKKVTDCDEYDKYEKIESVSQLIINDVYYKYHKNFFDSNKKIEFKKLSIEDFEKKFLDNYENENYNYDEYTRFNIIHTILENDLENGILSGNVCVYIIKIIEKYVEVMYENSYKISIKTFINNSYQNFDKIYKGSYYTKANEAERDLDKLINEYTEEVNLDDYVEIKKIIRKLATNYLVRYGQVEAQKMLKELIDTSYIDDYYIDDSSIEGKYKMCIYYCMLWNYKENIETELEEINEFKKVVSESQNKNNVNQISEYMKVVNDNIDDEIGTEDFEKLFSLKR